MSDENVKVPGGNQDENVPSGEGQSTPSGSADSEKKDKVAWETYQKSVSQEKSLRERNRELENKVNQFLEQQKQQEEERLQQKGETEKLLELRTKERDEYKNKYEDLNSHVEESEKISAFLDKLPGKIKRKEYLNFVPTKDIIVDPTTGEIDDSSVSEAVNNFTKNFSDLIMPSSGKRLPGDAPSQPSDLSYDSWLKMNAADKRKNMHRVQRNKK